MFTYSNITLKKLEQICQESEYIVRYEKGSFESGYCILENKKVIVINKFYVLEARINSLLEIIPKLEIDVDLLSEKSRSFLKKTGIQINQGS